MSEYLIQGDTMSDFAEQARRLAGASDTMNPAEMLEILSKVEGTVSDGTAFTCKAYTNTAFGTYKSGKYDRDMIFALPEVINTDTLKFQKWAVPLPQKSGYVKTSVPFEAAPIYEPTSDAIDIYINVTTAGAVLQVAYANYAQSIDWGDGTIENESTPRSHTYASTGYYKVSLHNGRNFDVFDLIGSSTTGLVVSEIVFPSSIEAVRDSAFDNLSSLNSVRFANGVEDIQFLESLTNAPITQLVIPASVKTGARNRVELSSLEHLVYDEGCDDIPIVFGSKYLKFLSIPSSVTEISGAFSYNTALETVVMGATIDALPDTIFSNCTSLKSVLITREDSVIKTSGHTVGILDPFYNTPIMAKASGAYIYVPDALLDAYKAESTWTYYTNSDRFKPLSEYVES